MNIITMEDLIKANQTLKGVVQETALQKNAVLSERYDCNVFLKREDLQIVRSFKIRGAFNLMQNCPPEILKNGVVCASAGNHAQGVAYSCRYLQVPGKIFMPTTTPRQKLNQVLRFGGKFVETSLSGDTFDDSALEAKKYCEKEHKQFVDPFNDPQVIAGQGTVGVEIMNQSHNTPDFIFATIGGGGLISGIGSYTKNISPATKIIGVEPQGAASMKKSLEAQKVIALDTIDKFVDGAAVKKVGDLTYEICQNVLDDIVVVPEGKVCTSILELYNENAIVAEPAGALAVAALDFYREKIKGKNVVCVISGGNNDIERMQEIKERSLLYEGLKHYFIIRMPQRPGALREFVVDILGPHDDITHFEYTKTNNKEKGPVLVGIEVNKKEDYHELLKKMHSKDFQYTELNENNELFNLLV